MKALLGGYLDMAACGSPSKKESVQRLQCKWFTTQKGKRAREVPREREAREWLMCLGHVAQQNGRVSLVGEVWRASQSSLGLITMRHCLTSDSRCGVTWCKAGGLLMGYNLLIWATFKIIRCVKVGIWYPWASELRSLSLQWRNKQHRVQYTDAIFGSFI